jgi:hypothetical protein
LFFPFRGSGNVAVAARIARRKSVKGEAFLI